MLSGITFSLGELTDDEVEQDLVGAMVVDSTAHQQFIGTEWVVLVAWIAVDVRLGRHRTADALHLNQDVLASGG
jgi:hypothetical protein